MAWINEIDTLIRDFLLWASSINPWLCLLTVLLVLFLEASLLVGMIIPGEAAVLLAAGALGVEWAFALFGSVVLASVLGQCGGYGLGRLVGPQLRRTWVGRKIGEQRWESAEAVVQGSGGRALITTRFVPFIHAVTPAAAGTLGIGFGRFVGLATIGATLWSAMLTSAALALGEAARVVGYGWIGLLLTGIGSVGAVTIIWRAVKARQTPSDARPLPVSEESTA